MKTKIYSIDCPRRIQFGDPLYVEKYKGKELSSLVVNRLIPKKFVAKVVLREEPYKECPDLMCRSIEICLGPQKYIDTYANGRIYSNQEIVEKQIGVDTACYYIDVDDRYNEINTGADGMWGNECILYKKTNKRKVIEGIIITIEMPEDETLESMEEMVRYFFKNVAEENC